MFLVKKFKGLLVLIFLYVGVLIVRFFIAKIFMGDCYWNVMGGGSRICGEDMLRWFAVETFIATTIAFIVWFCIYILRKKNGT